ncbi:hypothetical protein BX600DRAFT_473688 [Xylariales sp. PMI_506]|nr:hypothetical protein BX600DRAFT_473688 [Xylariales sp. PMI_506]
MSNTSEEQFFALAKADGPVDADKVAAVFDALPPATADQLVGGSWKGGSFDTGHPTHAQLDGIKWAGKDFLSVDEVHPMIVYGEDGARKWASDFGEARLRDVQFRGTVSTAMVYDKLPIIDIFKRVNQDTVMGAMDSKLLKDEGTYYFYLTRL